MVEFIEENELFNQSQHDFRIGRSFISQPLQQYDKILTIVEEGKNVDVVYIDFAKAFDKVDFKVLLEKVASLGFGGKVGRWLHTFLSNRTQRVMENGKLSDPSAVLSGVPQGSVLGPLLFLLVIGDIDNGLGISVLSSFADDTWILAAVSNVLQASKLQQDLEVVYEWARTNKMGFNSSKFELLRYWLNDDALKYCTNYTSPSGSIIPEKEHVKDLGVTLSDDGKFNEHVRKVIVKVKNLTSWILRSFSNRSAEVMLTLWKSLVLLHTEYAAQLWSPIKKGLIQQLEELQWSFVRKIKSCSRSNYWTTLKKFRLYSLEWRRERYRVIYLWKILEGLVSNLNTNGEVHQVNNERQGCKCRIQKNILNSLPRIRKGQLILCERCEVFQCSPKANQEHYRMPCGCL